MGKKKPFFCQNTIPGAGHKAKYFDNIENARQWLLENGGGTIKKRNAGIMRDPFIGEIRGWSIIEEVAAGKP
jgi:hypothetical protein